MKCYKMLYLKNGTKSNIGFYLIIPIIIVEIISIFIFCKRDFPIIQNIIKEIIYFKKGYNSNKNDSLRASGKEMIKNKSIIKRRGKCMTEIKNRKGRKNKNKTTQKTGLKEKLKCKNKDIKRKKKKGNKDKLKIKVEITMSDKLLKQINRNNNNITNQKKEKEGKDINDSEKRDTNINNPKNMQSQQLKRNNKHAPPKSRQLFKNKTTKSSFHYLRTNGNISNNPKNKMLGINNNLIDSDKKYSLDNLNKNKNFDKNILNINEYELNILKYEDALIIDKRNYTQYYFSLLRINHIILFIFRKNDYNSFIFKIYLFFFSFVLYYAVNALFFSDSTMHKIYEDDGIYNFIYQITQILYSTKISSVVMVLIKSLSLSEKNIIELKQEKIKNNLEKKAEEITKTLIMKFRLFFISSFVLLLFFWYYISCFCAAYRNTQLHLIKDSIISFGLSLLYPLGLSYFSKTFII